MADLFSDVSSLSKNPLSFVLSGSRPVSLERFYKMPQPRLNREHKEECLSTLAQIMFTVDQSIEGDEETRLFESGRLELQIMVLLQELALNILGATRPEE